MSRRNSNKAPKKAKEPKAPKAPKKGKAPKAPKAAKAPKATASRAGGKAPADVYTMFLFLALVALIAGCVFLFLEIKTYGPNPTSGAPGASLDREGPVDMLCEYDAFQWNGFAETTS